MVHSAHKGLKRGRGNKSSNISKGCMERDGGAQEQEGKGEGVKKAERDEEDYINQDGRRLKRREACLVSLREEKSWCVAQ